MQNLQQYQVKTQEASQLSPAPKTKKKKELAVTSDKTAAKTKGGLTLTQEEFCRLYAGADAIDRDLFGNGTQCYIEAFDVDLTKPNAYDGARVKACQLLTKVNVINRINELLEIGGFNDQNVDKQHLFLLNQHADLKTKLGAIREYNQLKKRIDNSSKTLILINGVDINVQEK